MTFCIQSNPPLAFSRRLLIVYCDVPATLDLEKAERLWYSFYSFMWEFTPPGIPSKSGLTTYRTTFVGGIYGADVVKEGPKRNKTEPKLLEMPGNVPKKFNLVVRIREVEGLNPFGATTSRTTAVFTAVVLCLSAEIPLTGLQKADPCVTFKLTNQCLWVRVWTSGKPGTFIALCRRIMFVNAATVKTISRRSSGPILWLQTICKV